MSVTFRRYVTVSLFGAAPWSATTVGPALYAAGARWVELIGRAPRANQWRAGQAGVPYSLPERTALYFAN